MVAVNQAQEMLWQDGSCVPSLEQCQKNVRRLIKAPFQRDGREAGGRASGTRCELTTDNTRAKRIARIAPWMAKDSKTSPDKGR